MNDIQISLLRWVLEGMSWDLVKIGKAIKSLRPYGIIYDSQFHNALGLLGEYMDVEITETLYVKLTASGDSRIDYMKLHKELFEQREQAQRSGMKVLEHNENGKNWVDDMDNLKRPLWLKVENNQKKCCDINGKLPELANGVMPTQCFTKGPNMAMLNLAVLFTVRG